MWKEIRKRWPLVFARSSFVVGNGRGVKFGMDSWCGREPLKVSFPGLFAMADCKDAWVRDLWSGPKEGEGWTLVFTRPFNDWELPKVERFLSCIERVFVVNEMEDMLKWEETKNGIFSVKSMHLALRSRPVESFPWLGVWKTGVQPKISLFTWEAIWGEILTCDQLQKRGFTLANRCHLCLEEEETMDHLLLHCVKTRT